MIEDIMKLGITNKFYDLLIEKHGYNLVLDMACNYELINKNINLLKSYGIIDIESLLLYREYILFYDTDYIIECFNKYDISKIVTEINDDYTEIDKVFK